MDEFTGRTGEGSVADWVTWIIDLLREHAVAPVREQVLSQRVVVAALDSGRECAGCGEQAARGKCQAGGSERQAAKEVSAGLHQWHEWEICGWINGLWPGC